MSRICLWDFSYFFLSVCVYLCIPTLVDKSNQSNEEILDKSQVLMKSRKISHLEKPLRRSHDSIHFKRKSYIRSSNLSVFVTRYLGQYKKLLISIPVGHEQFELLQTKFQHHPGLGSMFLDRQDNMNTTRTRTRNYHKQPRLVISFYQRRMIVVMRAQPI
jgi:hypothetical protein